jgi:hypothetical protein
MFSFYIYCVNVTLCTFMYMCAPPTVFSWVSHDEPPYSYYLFFMAANIDVRFSLVGVVFCSYCQALPMLIPLFISVFCSDYQEFL